MRLEEKQPTAKETKKFLADLKCPEQASFAAPAGSVVSPWLVRMCEGMRRDTYGIFVDGTTRPIIKSKNEAELQRVADAHNKTLPPNDQAQRPLADSDAGRKGNRE